MRIPTRPQVSPSEFPADATRTAPRPQPEKNAPAAAPRLDRDAVKVSLSARARQLAETQRPVEFDEAKVERLRTAIELGKFKIDTSVVANKLADNA